MDYTVLVVFTHLLWLLQFSWHQRVPAVCPYMLYIWRRLGTYQRLDTSPAKHFLLPVLLINDSVLNAVIWSVFQLTEIWGILLLQANQRSLWGTRTPQSIPETGWLHIGFYQHAPCLQTWVQTNNNHSSEHRYLCALPQVRCWGILLIVAGSWNEDPEKIYWWQ